MSLIVLLLIPFAVMGKTIICDQNGIDSGDCRNSTIDCGEVEECIIFCDSRSDLNLTAHERHTRGCYKATINCTGTKHCEVHCTGDWMNRACVQSNILCSNDCIVNASSSHSQIGGSSAVLFDSTIHIPEHSKSSILCTGYGPCRVTQIEVEPNAILNMICNGSSTCRYMNINANADNITIDVSCNGFGGGEYGVCDYLNINGNEGTNSSIITSCFALDLIRACSSSTISGGQNSSIAMICSHNNHSSYTQYSSYGRWSACSSADIIGGSGSHINVSCTDYAQCQRMKIDGRNAASLTLGDCSGNVECDDITIWCPQQVNGKRRCHLGKGDNLIIDALYAVNSWEDVELTTPIDCPCGGPLGLDRTLMYCGEDYDEICTVGAARWEEVIPPCDGPSSGCNVEQRPNEFTTCGVSVTVSDGSCQPAAAPKPSSHSHSESHLSTDRIVIIVVGSVCFVIVVVFLVLMVRKKRSGRNPEAIPMSEESDAFMQSDNH